MIPFELYAIVALLTVVTVLWLVRRAQRPSPKPSGDEQGWDSSLWSPSSLTLVERIFDRTDYLWLRDDVGFPALAESLLRSRRQIALNWLGAVRKSFDELIRTPGPVPGAHDPTSAPESWDLLRLLLRFHLVLGYAIVVVRLFGQA